MRKLNLLDIYLENIEDSLGLIEKAKKDSKIKLKEFKKIGLILKQKLNGELAENNK